MKIVMAKMAVDLLGQRANGASPFDHANKVAEKCMKHLAERGRGTGGLILLDKDGNPAFAFNTPRMAYGYVDQAGKYVVDV
jgi:isoaspartyl peptidase/L-asparaginase-like protein (Ntn-hydrolase superfamily)